MIRFAIDPDINKNGFAWLRDGERDITSGTMDFPTLVEEVKRLNAIEPVTAIIEGGWLNNSIFRISPYDTKGVIAKKGYNVGENHRTGKLIAQCLEHNGVKVEIIKPLLKHWKGKDRKVTHEELMKQILIDGKRLAKMRTNPDERDAVLILLYAKTYKSI